MTLWKKSITLGALTALLGNMAAVLPLAMDLEVGMGLDWLFRLRGPRPAPAEVIVVSIDRESSQRLGLPNVPRKWPRGLHGDLVRRLSEKGARAIAFDIIFEESRDPGQDRYFAEAVRDAGNVVLFEYLKSETRPLASPDGAVAGDINIEKRVPPIPELAAAAAATAPFPLPKVPVKVAQSWLFGRAGGAPTLPVVALQIHARPYMPMLRSLINSASTGPDAVPALMVDARDGRHDETRTSNKLRQLFMTIPDLDERLLSKLDQSSDLAASTERRALSTLIRTHSGPASRFLDFYGRPRSITTVPYHAVLNDGAEGSESNALPNFRGSVVFVGFSAELQPEQRDGFYTVFSQPDGLDVSGVEIAATTFANLLEGRHVQPLEPPIYLLLIAAWGIMLGMVLMQTPAAVVVPVAGLAAAAYLGIAYNLFDGDGTWLPLVTPLLLQLPMALVAGLLWRYLHSRSERRKMREALGYYLPGPVAEELAQSTDDIATKGRVVYGICLATDAENYTVLAEKLPPDQLRLLMNRYYETLFEPVTRRGGHVSDVVGDAMMAIWATTEPNPKLRDDACRAALDIVAAIDNFKLRASEGKLPTRIGLHCGDMLLGNIGAGHHLEYRAVGDIVNTASRIESLSKQLGSRVLASAAVVQDLSNIVTRDIGSFRMVGKSQPMVVHELVCATAQRDKVSEEQCTRFAIALEAFRAGHWPDAQVAFRQLLDVYGDHGPTRFYIKLCEQYANRPPSDPWDGVINLVKK